MQEILFHWALCTKYPFKNNFLIYPLIILSKTFMVNRFFTRMNRKLKIYFFTLAKIIGLTTIAILFAAQLLWGQTDSTAAFRPQTFAGLQYGQSWNNVNFSPRVAQTTLQASRFGAVIRYTAQPHLGIQLEFAYDQRGWAETRDEVSSNYTRTIDYLELAAFSHISIGKKTFRPLILLGSYLSYPIAQEESIPSDDIWTTSPLPYYTLPLPERLQYGLAGGVGIELFFKSFSFQIDGRYRSALGGIFSSDNEDFFFSNSQGFTAQASLLLRLFGGS